MRDGSPAIHAMQGRIVESGFRPHPLLRNPHLQTILPSLLRPLPRLSIRRERLELPDGDFVDLGWSGEHNAGGPLAVMVHGLAGGFESKYLRGLARRLIRRGWRSAILQLRGGGPEPNRLPRVYNHGDTEDLRYVWRWLRAREPRTPIASVGWSLGANVTLKALAEEGERAPVAVAAAACAPFQLRPCAEKLRTGFARLYQGRLLRELKAMVRRKHPRVPLPNTADLAAALAAADFFAFDDAYTAPLNGYRDALDYYARCSSAQFLRAIRRPTLIVHALDDPFMVPAVVPESAALSPQVTLELARHGGHVGFVGAGRLGLPTMWLEDRLAGFLADGRR